MKPQRYDHSRFRCMHCMLLSIRKSTVYCGANVFFVRLFSIYLFWFVTSAIFINLANELWEAFYFTSLKKLFMLLIALCYFRISFIFVLIVLLEQKQQWFSGYGNGVFLSGRLKIQFLLRLSMCGRRYKAFTASMLQYKLLVLVCSVVQER